MMDSFESGGRNIFLLGDSGYPQQPWLMTPFSNPTGPTEEAYNIAHKKTRYLVKRCIGVLKSRFRCLSRQRIVMYSPQKAGLIINACVVLHNILMMHGVPLPAEEEITLEMEQTSEADVPETIDPATILTIGRSIRDGIANGFV